MKKRIRLLFLVLLFIIFSVGISYSYFIYRRSSDTSVININLGRNTKKATKITAEEIEVSTEPMTATQARAKTDNYFDFNVTSENYTDEAVSYCISVEYGSDDPDKQRIPLSYISFDLQNRSNSSYYINEQSFDDISHMHCIFLDTQPAHDGGVMGNFRLRFWLNTAVTVSDTDTSSVFKATDDNPDDDRISYSDIYDNFVITVESDSREEYHEAYTIINNTSLRSGLDLSAVNAKILEFKYGYDETYDSIPSGFKKNNLQTSTSSEPIYSYYDSTNYKLVVFSESYIYTGTTISSLFSSLTNLETIEFNNFYFNNVTSLGATFKDLTHLQTLDLDVSTPYITSLSNTFYGCSSLTEINFGDQFSTANVTTMLNMFRGCSSLINLDISMFEFSKVTSLSHSIYNCSNLKNVDFGYCNLRKVTDIGYMFYGCTSLEHIYWETTNTPLVTTFNSCFYNCPCLISVDLSNLSFESTTDISNMFRLCESLLEIDLSNASNNNINNSISYLFGGCSSVRVIKIPNLDLSGVTNASCMFSGCNMLTRIDSMFNFTNVLTNISQMFAACNSLTSLNLSKMDVSHVTDFSSLFANCTNLIDLEISTWKTPSATNFSAIFSGCRSLKVIDISNFDNSLITSYSSMFNNCTSLVTIYVNENWVPFTVNYVVFDGDTKLVGGNGTVYNNRNKHGPQCCIDTPEHPGYLTLKSSNTRGDVVTGDSLLVNFNTLAGTTSNPNDYNILFNSITSIKFDNRKHNGFRIDVSYYGDGSVWMYVDGSAAYVSAPSKIVFPADSTSLFESFVNVEIINFNDWVDTSNVTQFVNAFRNLSKLESLDFTGLDMSKVQSLDYTFYNCTTITSIDLSNLNLSSLQSMYMTFGQDSEMTTCNFSGTTTTDNLTSLYSSFYRCRALTSLDLSGFDTSNVTTMRSLFNECISLTTIDLSNFDTTLTNAMYRMFYKCSALTTIYVSSSFVTTAVTSSGGMFTESTLLVGGNGTVYDSSHVDVTYAVIDTASTPGYFTLKS